MAWAQVSDYVPSGTVAAGAAGSNIQNSGLLDVSGQIWSVTSGVLYCASSSNPWQNGILTRLASEAAAASQRITIAYTQGKGDLYAMLLHNGQAGGSANGYALGISMGNGPRIYSVVNGGLSQVGDAPAFTTTPATGTDYVLDAALTRNADGTNSLVLTHYAADGTTVLNTLTANNDGTSALKSASGRPAMFAYLNGATQPNLTGYKRVTTYNQGSSSATKVTVTGPTSGAVGSASSAFTVALDGPPTADTTVTIASSVAGDTLTPSTLTFSAGSTASKTFTVTPSSSGDRTLTFANNGSLTNQSPLTYTGVVSNTLAPNNAAIVYSPGNWDVTAARALTINAGSRWQLFTTSASVVLGFDTSNNGSPLSQIEYRIDGYDRQAPWTTVNVASTVTLAMPSDTSGYPWHWIEFRVKSTSQALNRWNSPSATAVVLTGITLASGASVLAPGKAGKTILAFGDSITETIYTVNTSATNENDKSAAGQGWAARVGELLGATMGIVGFGSQGWTTNGGGNVPPFPTALSSIMAGVPRSFAAPPDLVLINHGTNDSGASASAVTSAVTSALNTLISNLPNVPIVVMRPFNGSQASAIQAGIAACSKPSQISFMDTTGFLNTAYGIDSGGLHPTGANNLAVIAPKVAAALRPILYPTGTSGPALPGFRPGFH